MWGIRVLKVCEECGCEYNSVSRELRCKECQEIFRKEYKKKHDYEYSKKHPEYHPEYNKRYKTDKPKSAIKGQMYQFWKFLKTLSDEELQAIYQVRRQKLKYISDWKERQEVKTQMKILCDVYKQRVGDRVLNKLQASKVDNDRFHREMMEDEY